MKTISLNCSVCNVAFDRALNQYTYQKKISGDNYKPLCGSKDCKKKNGSFKTTVNCANCSKQVIKLRAELNSNNFCSRSCSVTFNNKIRIRIKKFKTINCRRCSLQFTKNDFSKSRLCQSCKLSTTSNRKSSKKSYGALSIKNENCVNCGIKHDLSKKSRKYCKPCYTLLKPIIFHNMGVKAASKRVKRSKNEIYFHELCLQQYSNITNNELFFKSKYGNWDADLILHDHKIAVLWNGIWHYKKVRSGHSPQQTQARDKIKIDVINANNYTPYVIKDMGKHNKKFVEQQFEIFKEWLNAQMFLGYGI